MNDNDERLASEASPSRAVSEEQLAEMIYQLALRAAGRLLLEVALKMTSEDPVVMKVKVAFIEALQEYFFDAKSPSGLSL